MKIPILAFTQHNYATAIRQALGRGYDHAALVYAEWFRTGQVTGAHPAFNTAKKLFEEILNITDFTLPPIASSLKQDTIEKFLLKVPSSEAGKVLEIESVVISMKFGWSLCVSSQVGCRMGCTFCQTGRMGLIRQLTTEEIVAQLFTAQRVLGYNIRNVVFMGMGEPLDNFDAVMRAVEVMTDPAGCGLGKSHITISTSGRVDGIRRLIQEADPAINLALSVNAPNDVIRTQIMPLNRKYNMAALRQVLEEYCAHPRRSVLVEYVMLQGINDSLQSADELASYLQGLRVKINLIPYNAQKPDRYQPPSPEDLQAFALRLRQKGYYTLLRITKGHQIMAACGQLGNIALKKSLISSPVKSPLEIATGQILPEEAREV